MHCVSLFMVVLLGMLANVAFAHNYWLAWCVKVRTARTFDVSEIKHAFCESYLWKDCEAFVDYSNSGGIGTWYDKSPCRGRRRTFKDHRGVHWFECDGTKLVALHHPDQPKDYCTTKWSHRFSKEGFTCHADWFCGYEVKSNDPR